MKRRRLQQGILVGFLVLFIALVYFSKVAVHVTRYRCEDGGITNNPQFCKGHAEVIGPETSDQKMPQPRPETKGKGQETAPKARQPAIVEQAKASPDVGGARKSSFDIDITTPAEDVAIANASVQAGRVSPSVSAKYDPTVSDNAIAWVEYVEGDANIYYKDLESGTMIAVAASKDTEYNPFLSHGKLVYVKSVVQRANTANEIDLYDVRQNATTRLVCGENAKTLIDFRDNLLIYKENTFENNILLDTSALDNWNCRQPKLISVPKEENPVRVMDQRHIKVESPRGKHPCRILNLFNHNITNVSLPCEGYDATMAANETGYFFWDTPTTFRQIQTPQWDTAHAGYTGAESFVRVSNGKIAFELPDLAMSKLQYTRPDYDLVMYDTATGKVSPITKTMKTKEASTAGIIHGRDFDLDGDVLAWVDIRRDRTKPDIYVARIT